ncbi:MAG TPA: aminopeptidase N [Nocardioidaceae bacterium]|nr:aminopeptidase N [Nocardioidaceae bacterium]
MPSLTVDEARARADLLSVDSYDIQLDLTRGDKVFRSRSQITFRADADGETFLDVRPIDLLNAQLDDVDLDLGELRDGRLPLRLTAGEHRVVVEADMAYSHDGEGLHRSVDPADDRVYVYAMAFLDAAPRIIGCFDQPDLKAVYRTEVTAPTDWTVIGNARAHQEAPGRWRLDETQPLSTYFWTIVAGHYHSITREHDVIRLGIHATQSLAKHLDADADEIFRVTGQSFDAYHQLFGIRYPFGDYHQAFVPEFNAGAMENPGCVTFRDEMVFRSRVPTGQRSWRARVIVHEMAHQWFGDLVTMRWWDDLWLNESFAEYMAYRVCDDATDFTDSWVEFAHVRKHWGMLADQRASTHPVAGNGARDAESALADFDGISYAKGAAVLKQLNAYLGDDVFLAGVRQHLTDHAYGNATLADLLDAWKAAGAHDLDAWADGWLRSSGPDTLAIVDGVLRRTPPAWRPASRPHRLTLCRITEGGRAEDAVLDVTSDVTPLPWRPAAGGLLVPDGRDQTWAKIRYDADTLAALPDRIAAVSDPVTRGAIWLSLRDAVADAELPLSTAVDLLCRTLPHETEDIAVRALSNWAGTVLIGQFSNQTSDYRTRVSDALATRVETAPAGSGLQLAAVLGLIPLLDDADLLRSWLEGSPPHGLVMDAELRWPVLAQLARLGVVTDDDIGAELYRDHSAQGAIHAVRCRAALPHEESKARAWRGIVGDGSLSNYEVYALCEGFWWPDQDTLLTPYVERYFDEMPSTAALRSGVVVAQTASLAFPKYAVPSRTLELAEHSLRGEALGPGLRRSVADRVDDLRQALTVRAAS